MKRYFESVQFNHPSIVNSYNTNNPIDEYKDFFLNFANEIDAETIVDMGS